jgi:hypothetical protein
LLHVTTGERASGDRSRAVDRSMTINEQRRIEEGRASSPTGDLLTQGIC